MTLSRRSLLRHGGVAAIGMTAAPPLWRPALAADESGLLLPDGFTSRVIAVHGERVAGTDYRWHRFPDGGATFAMDDGGWVYVSNSEDEPGGVGAVRFDADGEIADAYRILDGTRRNCAGGPTPWNTWLSCEEVEDGQVYECEVDRAGQGDVRPALGGFTHEAAVVDPERERVYMTEDLPDGRLWRFTPSRYPDLDDGLLEAARVEGETVTWVAARADGTAFNGGEGAWYADGVLYFTTKGDNRVWTLLCQTDRLRVLYDGSGALRTVDNVTMSPSGDIAVAEEGGDLQVVLVDRDGGLTPIVQLVREGHRDSEITGPAFSPDGTRLYFSSQRGPEEGVTFEVRGPFSEAIAPVGDEDDDPLVVPAVGGAAVLAVVGGLVALRRRRGGA